MPNYKLVVTTGLSLADTRLISDAVFRDHGPDFDAELGDFTINTDDKAFTVFVNDVADGDVRGLADDIYAEHGDLHIRAFKDEGWEHWFPFDLEEDD